MSVSRLIFKQPTGWFTAGREFQQALRLLSDSAFKLYVWICLHADRRTGRIVMEAEKLAGVFDVERCWIDCGIAELCQRGVCRASAQELEIEDRFWPYEKQVQAADATLSQAGYVRSVRALFMQPACVRSAFTAADERIAVELYCRGVELNSIRHAIWLGCARRYAVMLNGQTASPIASLHYFAVIVDEVTQSDVPAGYWEHVRQKVDKLERQWLQRRPMPAACPTSPETRPASPE